MKILLIILLAALISCTHARYENFLEIKSLNSSSTRADIEQFLLNQYKDIDHEQLWLVALKNGHYIASKMVTEGGTRDIHYDLFQVYVFAKSTQADEIWETHNHVGFYFAYPSETDLKQAQASSDFGRKHGYTSRLVIISEHDIFIK